MRIKRLLLLVVLMTAAAPVWSGGIANAATACTASVGTPGGEYASVGGREVRYGVAGSGSLTCDNTATLLGVTPCVQTADVLAPTQFTTIPGGCNQASNVSKTSVYARAWAQCVPAATVIYRTQLDFVVEGDIGTGYVTGHGASPSKEVECSLAQATEIKFL